MKKNKSLKVTIPLMIMICGFFLYQYGYVEIRSEVSSIKESQAIKTKTLGKYITLIAEKPEMEKKLATLKESRKDEDSYLIEGQTATLAAASLQQMVKDIVLQSGGTISSERVGNPEDLGSFKVITVSIDTVLPDARALRDILYSIETRTPYLTVKDLDIRVRNYRNPKEQVAKIDVSALTSSR